MPKDKARGYADLFLAYPHKKAPANPGTVPKPYYPKSAYDDGPHALTYAEYLEVVKAYLTEVVADMRTGHTVALPKGLGTLKLERFKPTKKIVDMHATRLRGAVVMRKRRYLDTYGFWHSLRWIGQRCGFPMKSWWVCSLTDKTTASLKDYFLSDPDRIYDLQVQRKTKEA